MSGFEVAGIVLGAIPLAISALEHYRDVATRLGLFYKIKLEYRKCSNDLEFYKLTYTRNLKQLLLPLVVDDEKITELVGSPGGDAWMDASIASLLQTRLKDSYALYLEYINGMREVMDKLYHELALDSQTVQDKLADITVSISTQPQSPASSLTYQKPSSNKAGVKAAVSKDNRLFQLYRVKFSNGESVRKKLFKELQEYNNKLEKLLDSSDKESRLVQQRASAKQATAVDTAICGFWIQAAKLFKALAAAWNCRCSGQHCAKLLLQHRTRREAEFEFLFTRSSTSSWEIKKARIAQEDAVVSLIFSNFTPTTHQLHI